MNTGPLLPLVGLLKDCATADSQITAKRLQETWSCYKSINPEHGDTVTPAVIAGVILYDTDTFAPLLNAAELAQLQALATTAQERYLQLIIPPQLGKTIAATLKGEI